MSKKKTKNVKRPLSRLSSRDLLKASGGAGQALPAEIKNPCGPVLGFPTEGGTKHAPLFGFPSEGRPSKETTKHAPLFGMPSFK